MDQGFIPTLASQAMLTIPILDFQSNPMPPSPLWHFVKVRVQGSCVLCAHGPALFVPNPSPFFFFFTVPEWRDAPQRSWTWISFGLTQWKGQRRAPWNGSDAFTPPSQGPESSHHPEMAQVEPFRGPLSAEPGGVPWAPVTLSCLHVALVSLQQENRSTVWGAERSYVVWNQTF